MNHELLAILGLCLSGAMTTLADPPAPRPRVFAGGVAGVEDLAVAEHSARFRAAGGGLYLHNNGWAALDAARRRQVLDVFAGRPIAIELGFNPDGTAWAHRFQTGYASLGIVPEFICANAFDRNHLPTPDQWSHFVETLRSVGGVPASTLILPTFEYANFAANRPTLEVNKVSQRSDFQTIIESAGGLALDVPAGYFFAREHAYREWVLDAIRWARARGLRVVHILSPHHTRDRFAEEAARLVTLLRDSSALPDTLVVENYEAHPPPGYPNRVGPETAPNTALGVALALLEGPLLRPPRSTPSVATGMPEPPRNGGPLP